MASLVKELTEEEARTMVTDYGKREGRALSKDSAENLVKKMTGQIPSAAQDLMQDDFKLLAKRTIRDALEQGGKDMVKKGGEGGITKLAGNVIKYGGAILIAKQWLAVQQSQSPDECKTKCLAGTNGDQTQYATESKTPDPNCPSGQTAPQCKMYCSTTDPGACSRKNNLARGTAKCSGTGLFECTRDSADDAFSSFHDFWGAFGGSITYLGYGLSILFILILVYYTAKTFMTTNVNKAISVATRGEVTQVIGKKRGGARKFKLK